MKIDLHNYRPKDLNLNGYSPYQRKKFNGDGLARIVQQAWRPGDEARVQRTRPMRVQRLPVAPHTSPGEAVVGLPINQRFSFSLDIAELPAEITCRPDLDRSPGGTGGQSIASAWRRFGGDGH